MPVKVAIVEDDTGVRESLAALLAGTSGLSYLGAYSNAEVALKVLPHNWPDVVLMDINLPNMSGIECACKLKELHPPLQIIMLTVYGDSNKIFDSLAGGASGYLLKKTPPAKIVEAILDVHGGGSPMSNTIARKVVQHFQKRPSANPAESLSKREQEVLALLAKGQQYKEIGEALSISLETVRVHIRHIYEKLHVRSRTEAVVKYLGKE